MADNDLLKAAREFVSYIDFPAGSRYWGLRQKLADAIAAHEQGSVMKTDAGPYPSLSNLPPEQMTARSYEQGSGPGVLRPDAVVGIVTPQHSSTVRSPLSPKEPPHCPTCSCGGPEFETVPKAEYDHLRARCEAWKAAGEAWIAPDEPGVVMELRGPIERVAVQATRIAEARRLTVAARALDQEGEK